MKRSDFEHIIRASSAILNEEEFIVIGSQSILALENINIPEILLKSRELDIYPKNNHDKADIIEGAIGELSFFDKNFGYYAQSVSKETAILTENWIFRLNKVQNKNTNMAIAYCLDPHDLAISKIFAGRPKDYFFVEKLIEHNLVSTEKILTILNTEKINKDIDLSIKNNVLNWFGKFKSKNKLKI
jgi:hypothetical protein